MLVDLQDNEIKVGSKVVWNGSSGLHIGVVQNITQKSVAVQRITPPIKYNWETGRVNVPVTLANRRLLVLDVSGTLADDGG